MTKATKIAIENVVSPGRTRLVDATKYEALKNVLLRITPTKSPGLSAVEMREKMLPMLPQDLWPNGEKVGWWQKAVQLDLEAKGVLCRDEKSKPLRWWRSA
ncbi:MAG TPA: hypothetical protein VNZ27_05730 [Rhodanobacter sp.]|jgi:hypothetical protein|nr:hypothetical protein [Rhodanobacter sp.]